MIDMFTTEKEEEKKQFLARLKEFIKGNSLDRNLLIKKFFASNSKQVEFLNLNINDYLD